VDHRFAVVALDLAEGPEGFDHARALAGDPEAPRPEPALEEAGKQENPLRFRQAPVPPALPRGGEDLADRSIISPFVAMWSANILIGVAGLYLMYIVSTEKPLWTVFKLTRGLPRRRP